MFIFFTKKNDGKLASKHFMLNDDNNEMYEPELKRKKGAGNRVKQPLLSARFRGIDAESVEKIGDFFKDKEFCIALADDKSALEKYVLEKSW